MIVGFVLATCAYLLLSVPAALLVGQVLRRASDRDAANTLERDHLVRTIIASSGNGVAAMALRTVRPDLEDNRPERREMLKRQAQAAARAYEQADPDWRDANGSKIPVGAE